MFERYDKSGFRYTLRYKIVAFESYSEEIGELKRVLDKGGFCYSEDDFEFIFVVGGDGSFLHFFKKYAFLDKDVKIIGIGSSGKISFLSDLLISDAQSVVKKEYSELQMIKVTCGGEIFYALNDFYLEGNENLMLECNVGIEGEFFQKYRSLGLLVSTQLGSTALNKSLNGSIIFPSVSAWLLRGVGSQNSKKIHALENGVILSEKESIVVSDISDVRCYVDGRLISLSDNTIELTLIKSKSRALFNSMSTHMYIDKIKRTFLDG